MSGVVDRIRLRLIPALLTAIGVGLLAIGLLSYSNPVTAEPVPSPSPSPTPVAVAPTPSPRYTLPPLASAGASEAPTASAPIPSIPVDRVATRVRVAALRIDLPVMIEPVQDPQYPACNVAMYVTSMWQPGQDRSIYLYAHARSGMFLPILDASRVANGKKMLGMIVEVWTSDDQKFLYEITEVRRHQHTLEPAFKATTETLWLQTSEGPHGTFTGKTQVIAKPLAHEAADPADAHPKPHPVRCGPPKS